MPFAATIHPEATPSAYVSSVDDSFDRRFRSVFATDAIRSQFSELRVAGLKYPLRQACRALYIPGAGDFLVEGFSPTFVGHGETLEEARDNWLLSVHASFQELLCKRPFERDENDREHWSVLSSRIDVAIYRNQTPIQVRQFGRVRHGALPFPSMIEWEDGRREVIKLNEVDCPDFVTFKPGQPIEAVVVRDAVDFRMLRIAHVERRSEPTRLSSKEEAELLESIGSSHTLAGSDWD